MHGGGVVANPRTSRDHAILRVHWQPHCLEINGIPPSRSTIKVLDGAENLEIKIITISD
jgi:hypothetical protein